MPPLAYTALSTSIVLSALGAVIICLLTALYGFTPDSEESAGRAARRALLTRVGHAMAAACFAGTAILLAVVLAQPMRSTSAPAADPRVPALDAKLDAQVRRLHGVEQRMKDSEHTLERLEMEVSDVAARRMGPEAAVEAPGKSEEKPARRLPVSAVKPAPAKTSSSAKTAPSAERQDVVTLPAERPVQATAPPAIAVPSERALAPTPSDEPAASPGSSPPATPPLPSAPRSAAPSPSAPRSAAPPPANDLRSKFQNDWQAIQRGWDRAAEDLRRAIGPLRKD